MSSSTLNSNSEVYKKTSSLSTITTSLSAHAESYYHIKSIMKLIPLSANAENHYNIRITIPSGKVSINAEAFVQLKPRSTTSISINVESYIKIGSLRSTFNAGSR